MEWKKGEERERKVRLKKDTQTKKRTGEMKWRLEKKKWEDKGKGKGMEERGSERKKGQTRGR